MSRLNTAVISGLSVALVASGAVILHQTGKMSRVRQQRDAALQSLQQSRQALQQSKIRISSLRNRPIPINKDKAVVAQQKTTIQQLTSQLKSARQSVSQVQEELASTKDQNQKALAASGRQSREIQSKLQARLAKLHQELASAKSKIQSSSRQIADLEKLNTQLQNSNSGQSTRIARREHILDRLQELDRRRESYLRSIANRYHNLTSQFRSMSGMMDSNRGQNSSALSGSTLDMIQNSISLSETDFQHLSDLNAKAFRLQKQLSKQ